MNQVHYAVLYQNRVACGAQTQGTIKRTMRRIAVTCSACIKAMEHPVQLDGKQRASGEKDDN